MAVDLQGEWRWSRGAATLLRVAKFQTTVAVVLTVNELFRGFAGWRVVLLLWTLALLLVWAGLSWRRASRMRSQIQRDSRAAVLVRRALVNEGDRFALYIRPFDWTDVLPVRNPAHRPSEDPFRELPTIDVEEFFAQGLEPFLPMVALGWPGEAIGAGRYETDDRTWRSDVHTLAERATLIIALPLYTESMVWEVELLRERGWLEKTVFVMPPLVGPFRHTLARRWWSAREHLERINLSLPPLEKGGMIFVLTPDGASIAHSRAFPECVDGVAAALQLLMPRISSGRERV